MELAFRHSQDRVKVATLRGAFYGALARAFGPGVEGLASGVCFSELGALQACLPEVWGALSPELSQLSRLKGLRAEELSLEHTRLFVKGECPPYETSYVKRPFAEVADRSKVAGFYAAFGLAPRGEHPDHLVSELEFMGLLCLKEAYALSNGIQEQAEVCLDAQRKFLSEHLAGWVGRFKEKVKAASRTPLYPLLAELLCKFVAAELNLIRPEAKA